MHGPVRLRLDGDYDDQRDCHYDDDAAEQHRHPRSGQFNTPAHRDLHVLPTSNRQHRQHPTRRRQRGPEAVSDTWYGKGWDKLDNCHAACEEGERSADPRKEGPLVGKREAIIQLSHVLARLHVPTH
jgi:hypothetical protein